MIKLAGYPDNPDEVVIKNNDFYDHPIKEIDIWNYYEGIKSKLISELKGYDLFVVISPNIGKKIYKRHPYDEDTEFIRINNEKEFEEYHSGRTVEYHRTSDKITDSAVFDIDPGPSATFDDIKNVVGKCEKFIKDKSGIFTPNYEIRYTGSRGFHIHSHIKNKKNISNIKSNIESKLKKYFEEDDQITIAPSNPPSNKVNIDLSPMKVSGGHVAPYSIRIDTGLVCMPVKNYKDFDKDEATIDKVYKGLTGKKFKWDNKRKEKDKKSTFLFNEKIIDSILEKKT